MALVFETAPVNSLANISNTFIKKAFDGNMSIEMLTINEFIKKTEFPIDTFMVDKFYHNLNDDMNIYITDEIIAWCGYSGETRTQKMRFNEILSKFERNVDYWIYEGNRAYETYYNSMYGIKYIENEISINLSTKTHLDKFNYPHPDTFKGKNKTNHIITTVDCFREIMMMLTTKKAKSIRQYYICLEKLIKIYGQYQYYHQQHRLEILSAQHSELLRKMDEQTDRLDTIITEQANQADVLDDMSDKLDRATEERAPKTVSTKKHEKFLLLRTNEDNNRYYAIRANTANSGRSYDNIMIKHPNAVIILSFEQQPNAKNLFHHISEILGKTGTKQLSICGNYIRLTRNYTEAMMLADITDIEARKKDL
jgi:phage anti-repressor protein